MKTKQNAKKILIGFLIITGLTGFGIYRAFFDMSHLPTGDYLTEVTSPNGDYTVKAYLTNGGATTAYAVRAELIFNTSERQTKNIYWNYRESTAEINWQDTHTVTINGRSLNVPNETYDFRNR